ncbi:MAG TPA: FeoC-like transcriptional regulator [Clostridia bacterium]|nr:FeoC-like transcriptional regulator [Clostridia bacterium]
MLKEILKIIYSSGYFSNRDLAKQLNVTEEVIIDGINQLINMGYLKREAKKDICPTSCTRCPYVQSCNKDIVETYQITEKGMSVI